MNSNKIIIYTVSFLFAASLLLCLGSLFYTSFERISYKGFKTTMAEYEEEEREILKIVAYQERWQNIDKEFDQFKDEYLLKIDEFSQFRNRLKSIIMNNRLANKDISHKYRNIFNDIIKVDLGFTVTGAYPNIKKFIHEIIGDKKLILLRRIELTRSKHGMEITGKFAMEVYLVR
jgi:Tfp pilus assembly protein PilO